MRKDTTTRFWNWLESNSTMETKRNCYGETIRIYHIPHEKVRDFTSEYNGALVTVEGRWDAWDCAELQPDGVMDCIVGPEDLCSGKYIYHMRGSDYDTGFYEPGPSGVIDCESHVCFDRGTLYFSPYSEAPELMRNGERNVVVFEKNN